MPVDKNRKVATENGHDKLTVAYASRESETEHQSVSTGASRSQKGVKPRRNYSANTSHPQNNISTIESVGDGAS